MATAFGNTLPDLLPEAMIGNNLATLAASTELLFNGRITALELSAALVGFAKICPVATGVAATDTAAVQAFINASSAGDTLFFPAGEYAINAIISFKPGRRYFGSGNAKAVSGQRTAFVMAASANLDAVWASDTWTTVAASPVSAAPVWIENICFDGNYSAQASGIGAGLILMSYQSRVVGCKFANTLGEGMRYSSANQGTNTITNTMNELFVQDCQFNQCKGGGFRSFEGDATARCTDGNFVDNIIQCWNIDAVPVCNGVTIDKGAGWKVNDNHIYSCPGNGVKITQWFQTQVSNNYIEGYGYSLTAGTYMGINGSTGFISTSTSNTVNGNRIWAGGSALNAATLLRGIGLTAATSATARLAVTGNTVYGRTNTALTQGILISCNDAGGTIEVSLSGNAVPLWDTPMAIGTTGTVKVNASANTGAVVVAETFGAAFAFNAAKASANGYQRLTLTGNITSSTITAGIDGQTIRLMLIQDGTGSRTIVWPTNVNGPTLSTGIAAVDIIDLSYSALDTKWHGRLL